MKWISILNYVTKRKVGFGSHKVRCGFTLTEFAIVLCVAGVILGGVWVAASSVQENARQATLKNEIATVVQNVRALYAGRNGILGNTTPSTLTAQWIMEGVIPGNMVRTDNNCVDTYNGNVRCADNPWGMQTRSALGSFAACAYDVQNKQCLSGPTTPSQYFAINTMVPLSSCAKAIAINSGADAPPGLYDVYVNFTSLRATGASFPVAPQVAQTTCSSFPPPVNILFVYRVSTPQN